ncbi:DUF397 domain-containing protein [Actinomadura sp. 6K520]|uniref:DUF397 domain-containing protein n=1 Tax=Actinomadura sp. 6K520 TaxID=2530364 RepID=UPI001045C5FF|nr:DUF397 domain-containing protein [Actinomadura sp. 6K520]TDE39260.1 DUF397 domain-containing protein [Actinomadura sp. 6K520]
MPTDASDDPKCAELEWRTATASGAGDCVQVARSDHGIAVRDSKDPYGPRHSYRPDEWARFIARIKMDAPDLTG